MYKALSSIAASLLLVTACQTTDEYAGSGPIELAPSIERCFQDYLQKDNGYAFAVAIDGTSNCGYVFCEATSCSLNTDWRWRAINHCQKKSGGIPCKLYAVRDRVVWNESGPRLWDSQNPPIKKIIYSLNRDEFPAQDFHTKRDWLTATQLKQFEKYLRVLEKGEYPVGTFVVADDGHLEWTTHSNDTFGPKRSANRALTKCRDRAKLPDTCRIFALNDMIISTETTTTARNYKTAIKVGTGLVEDVEAFSRKVRIVWENLAPPFEVEVKPVYESGAWLTSFSPPNENTVCSTITKIDQDGKGTWSALCDNGKSAAGEIKLDPQYLSSTSTGKDNIGGNVYVYSTPIS